MEKARLASAAVDQRSEPAESNPLQKAATPWLVIPHGKDKEFQTFYNISQLNNTSSYGRFLPELKGKSIWQKNSHQGWCILLCDDNEFDYTPWNYGDCLLWNPIAPTETIMLPSLLYWYKLDGYCLSDCVLSSPPHDGGWNGNPNPMVFILFVRKDPGLGKEILVFCHLGDKEWRSHKFPEEKEAWVEGPESMCYHKGKLYMIGWGVMFLFELEPEIILLSKIRVDYKWGDASFDYLGRNFGTPCKKLYYVESSDEIFMIRKVFIPRGVYDEYCVTNMLISKFDFSSMTWVEVTSLDDCVLFLSGTTRLCCSAKELGFARGWVYFTQHREMSYCKYDLEDKTFMLSMPCPDLPKPWFSPNWLMIPPTLWDDDGSNTEVIENSSLAISPIRTRTSINNDDDEKDKDIEEARPPWDILTEDILWFLSSYLSPLDFTHLRAVCRNYRSVFPIKDWRKFCSTRTLQTNVLAPWMVFPKDNESVYNFINPVHNDENYLTSIPELLKGLTIRCSKGGWLLMSNNSCRQLFYNPFTKEIIQLPGMVIDCHFRGMSFSSLPTSPDCVVFGISDNNSDPRDFVYITFIKRGQNMWTFESFGNAYLHLPSSNRANMSFDLSVNSPVYYYGRFCCLDLNGTVGVFSLENGMTWQVLSIIPPPNCGFIYKSYLVELEGKLLSILLGHYGTWVRVFRLDFSKVVWVEVEHLGKNVLFISNTSCIATIAQTSQMENKIYFPRLQNEGILFYSLDSGKYHSLGSEHYGTDYCNSKDNLRCSWIEPNWSETTHPNFVW